MKKSSRVSEAVPVQVYLRPQERARLERLAAELKASRADVLRRALEVLEHQLLDPEQHPLLKLSGIGVGDRGPKVDYDPTVEHDRYLAEVLTARGERDFRALWGERPRRRARRRRRGRG